MNLDRATAFAKVVEMGGFSVAARKLQMPKTTLSKKVRDLEKDLGVRLLNRTTRRVTLTEAGSRFYEHCLIALQRMETAAQEARALQIEPGGRLRIGAPSALGTGYLMPMLIEFMAHHPRITTTLLLLNDPVTLTDEDVDVLVWVGEFDRPAHTVRLVSQLEMGLFASALYLKGFGAPLRPADLAKHRAVAFTQSRVGDNVVWRLRRGTQTSTVTLSSPPRFTGNDGATIRPAIAAGLGIGILPVRYAVEGETAGDLIRVLPAWQSEPVEVNALYLDGHASSRKTRLFLDFAAEWFKKR